MTEPKQDIFNPPGTGFPWFDWTVGKVTDLWVWARWQQEHPKRKDPDDLEWTSYLTEQDQTQKNIPVSPADVWDTLNVSCDILIVDPKTGQSVKLESATEKGRRRFRYLGYIGSGSFGAIFLIDDVTNINNIVRRALKVSLDDTDSRNEKALSIFVLIEFILKKRCPNFIRLDMAMICHGAPPNKGKWKEFHDKLTTVPVIKDKTLERQLQPTDVSYLSLEYSDSGTLESYVSKHTLSQSDFESLIFQLLFTLAAMQKTGFLHRDLHPGNVLVSSSTIKKRTKDIYNIRHTQITGGITREQTIIFDPLFIQTQFDPFMIKLIDFGLSTAIKREQKMDPFQLTWLVTQIFHRPPELFFFTPGENPRFTYRSDLWSMGVIIATVSGGRGPFFNRSETRNGGFYFLPPRQLQMDYHNYNINSHLDQYTRTFLFTESKAVLPYVWNMVEALGWPTNKTWPGVENSFMWKLLNKYKHHFERAHRGGWLHDSRNINASLGKTGVELMLSMLEWDPDRRPEAGTLLINYRNSFFKKTTQAGDRLHEIDPIVIVNWTLDFRFQRKTDILDDDPAHSRQGFHGQKSGLIDENIDSFINNHHEDKPKEGKISDYIFPDKDTFTNFTNYLDGDHGPQILKIKRKTFKTMCSFVPSLNHRIRPCATCGKVQASYGVNSNKTKTKINKTIETINQQASKKMFDMYFCGKKCYHTFYK